MACRGSRPRSCGSRLQAALKPVSLLPGCWVKFSLASLSAFVILCACLEAVPSPTPTPLGHFASQPFIYLVVDVVYLSKAVVPQLWALRRQTFPGLLCEWRLLILVLSSRTFCDVGNALCALQPGGFEPLASAGACHLGAG